MVLRPRLISRLALSLSALAFLAGAGPADAAGHPERPNIVLISLDTTRADYLTFHDAETAPNLTALAKRGTIFSEAISGSSWTLPAHAQMFTGMAPPYHGAEIENISVDPKTPMLAELLNDAGYHTIGVFTSGFLFADYGFGRGFDYYHSAILPDNVDKEEIRYTPSGQAGIARLEQLRNKQYSTSDAVVKIARRALERARPEDPVFLFAHFFDPHDDYMPPPPYDTKFDPDYRGDFDATRYKDNPKVSDPSKTPSRQISDRDLQYVRALYRGEIAWTDHCLGELLEVLRQHDRLENTVFLVTSDHGEEFFEHGLPGHRLTLYDEVLRVPFLVVPPAPTGESAVRDSSTLVTLSDVMPTLLDYAQVAPPPGVVGSSLRSALGGRSLGDREALVSLYIGESRDDGGFTEIQAYGLRTTAFKVLRFTEMQSGEAPKSHVIFFDLAKDPEEKAPMIGTVHPEARAAWLRLEERLYDVDRHWGTYPRSPREDRIANMTLGFARELQILGYLDVDEGFDHFDEFKAWGLSPLLASIPSKAEPSSDWTLPILVPTLLITAAALGLIALRRARK